MEKIEEKNYVEYKRKGFSAVEDFFYETTRRVFYKNGRKKSSNTNFKKENRIFIFALLFIPCVNWLVFWLYVNLQSIILAFQDARTGAFTLNNFVKIWDLITNPINNELGISIINTLKYFGTVLIVINPLCLIVAYFFYKKILGYRFFRIVFYLPSIISSIVMVTAFSEFINPVGPLGSIQRFFGKTPDPVGYLANPDTATNTILIYCVLCGLTTNVLLFSSGMSRIPIEILEATKLDGVGPVRELFSMIFPLIWPTFSTQMVFTLTGIFSATGPILMFTNGAYDTSTIAFWIFKQMYGTSSQGPSENAYALVSCAGFCFTMIGLPIVLAVRKIVEKIDPVEY